MKKLLSILFDIVIVIIIVLAVLLTFMSLNTNDKGITSIKGYMFFNIQTDSMEPTIKVGDLIISRESNFDDVKVGDVISFLAKEEDETIIKTHRVTIVDEVDGIISLTTKGDHNDTVDSLAVERDSFVGVYEGKRVSKLGGVFTFLQSRFGFFLFIILPLFAVFVYQLYKFIAVIVDGKKREIIAQAKKELREEKED